MGNGRERGHRRCSLAGRRPATLLPLLTTVLTLLTLLTPTLALPTRSALAWQGLRKDAGESGEPTGFVEAGAWAHQQPYRPHANTRVKSKMCQLCRLYVNIDQNAADLAKQQQEVLKEAMARARSEVLANRAHEAELRAKAKLTGDPMYGADPTDADRIRKDMAEDECLELDGAARAECLTRVNPPPPPPSPSDLVQPAAALGPKGGPPFTVPPPPTFPLSALKFREQRERAAVARQRGGQGSLQPVAVMLEGGTQQLPNDASTQRLADPSLAIGTRADPSSVSPLPKLTSDRVQGGMLMAETHVCGNEHVPELLVALIEAVAGDLQVVVRPALRARNSCARLTPRILAVHRPVAPLHCQIHPHHCAPHASCPSFSVMFTSAHARRGPAAARAATARCAACSRSLL